MRKLKEFQFEPVTKKELKFMQRNFNGYKKFLEIPAKYKLLNPVKLSGRKEIRRLFEHWLDLPSRMPRYSIWACSSVLPFGPSEMYESVVDKERVERKPKGRRIIRPFDLDSIPKKYDTKPIFKGQKFTGFITPPDGKKVFDVLIMDICIDCKRGKAFPDKTKMLKIKEG